MAVVRGIGTGLHRHVGIDGLMKDERNEGRAWMRSCASREMLASGWASTRKTPQVRVGELLRQRWIGEYLLAEIDARQPRIPAGARGEGYAPSPCPS